MIHHAADYQSDRQNHQLISLNKQLITRNLPLFDAAWQ